MALSAIHKDISFHVGDTVRVYYRIIEHEKIAGKTKRSVEEKVKERIQPFEGVVIGIKGSEENKSFTVRRLADQNIGVERVFPLISPWIEKIEVTQQGKVRRAKLNYLKRRGNLDVRTIRIEKINHAKVKNNAVKRASSKKSNLTKQTRKSRGDSGTKASSA